MGERMTVEVGTTIPELLVDAAERMEYDEGNLLGMRYEPLERSRLHANPMERALYLDELARDSCQLLLNRVFTLPTTRLQSGEVLAALPEPKLAIPRERPVPTKAPKTRWDRFAAEKGIQKRKKSKLVYDETAQDWRRRWGAHRANDPTDVPVMEVSSADPDAYRDPWTSLRKDKRARVQKQRRQERRNEVEALAVQRQMLGVPESRAVHRATSRGLSEAAVMVNQATASLGKFNRLSKKEHKVLDKSMATSTAKKARTAIADKPSDQKVMERILNRGSNVDSERLASIQLSAEHRNQKGSANKSGKGKRGGGGKKKGGRR